MASETAPTPPQRALPALAIFAAAALTFYGLGDLLTEAYLAPTRWTLWQAESGLKVADDDLEAAARAALWVAELRPRAELWETGAIALTKRLGGELADDARAHLIVQARHATRQSLSLAPLNPSAWLRLAYLERESGHPAAAARALDRSILVGPVAPALILSRLGVGLSLIDHLDPDARTRLGAQVALAQALAPEDLAKLDVPATARAFFDRAIDRVNPIAPYLIVLHRVLERATRKGLGEA